MRCLFSKGQALPREPRVDAGGGEQSTGSPEVRKGANSPAEPAGPQRVIAAVQLRRCPRLCSAVLFAAERGRPPGTKQLSVCALLPSAPAVLPPG